MFKPIVQPSVSAVLALAASATRADSQDISRAPVPTLAWLPWAVALVEVVPLAADTLVPAGSPDEVVSSPEVGPPPATSAVDPTTTLVTAKHRQ